MAIRINILLKISGFILYIIVFCSEKIHGPLLVVYCEVRRDLCSFLWHIAGGWKRSDFSGSFDLSSDQHHLLNENLSNGLVNHNN